VAVTLKIGSLLPDFLTAGIPPLWQYKGAGSCEDSPDQVGHYGLVARNARRCYRRRPEVVV